MPSSLFSYLTFLERTASGSEITSGSSPAILVYNSSKPVYFFYSWLLYPLLNPFSPYPRCRSCCFGVVSVVLVTCQQLAPEAPETKPAHGYHSSISPFSSVISHFPGICLTLSAPAEAFLVTLGNLLMLPCFVLFCDQLYMLVPCLYAHPQ